MADPNTQIDWWIAQAWQEAQGGADSDALVAWLYENGLTAISSYTILQAALNCSPEEARQMVFSHPVWASEDASQDLTDIEYTSETLEPEPEPDPTFELDEWAEEVEEQGPVYGEEGYRVEPGAGALPPDRPDAAADGLEGYHGNDFQSVVEAPEETVAWDAPAETPEFPEAGQDSDHDALPPLGGESEAEEAAYIQSGYGQDEDVPDADAPMSAAYGDDADPEPEEVSEDPVQPSAQAEPASFADLPGGQPAEEPPAGHAGPGPVAVARPDTFETHDIADSIAEPEPEPVRPSPPPTASPPTRMPPSTPAERAAVFAAAFGKKPAAASASAVQNKAPPPTDSGPAAYAEVAPAQTSQPHPQPTPAAAAMPPLPVFDPLPPIEIDDRPAPVDPLFGFAHRSPEPPQPLFAGVGSAGDDGGDAASPENEADFEEHAEPAIEDPTSADEIDSASDLPDLSASDSHHPEFEELQESEDMAEADAEPAFSERGEDPAEVHAAPQEAGDEVSDSAPDTSEEVVPAETLDGGASEEDTQNSAHLNGEISADDDDAVTDDDSEQAAEEPAEAGPVAPPSEEDDMAVSEGTRDEPSELAAMDDEHAAAAREARLDPRRESTNELEVEEEEAEPTARPRKRILLDPDEDRRQARMRHAEPQLTSGADPEDMAEAARRLGINFRTGDPTDSGIDPRMTQAARELGVSFRDEPTLSAQETEEMALAAQKLGISFRDPLLNSGKPQKPLLVRYIPLLIGMIIIFFLLLAAAPFAGRIGSWF